MSKLELREKQFEYSKETIENIVIDGYHTSQMKEYLIQSRGKKTADHIMSNAYKVLPFFADTKLPNSSSKILCLGKVQSGKTAFFISSIALAFDNGYNVCMLFGGTKNNLLDQNLSRLYEDFQNNPSIKIIELRNTNQDEILDHINAGYKIILVVLKNVSNESSNLYEALSYSSILASTPTLIIDDESDEHTPGAPKRKAKNPRAGITHDVISDLLESYKNVTIMFVTATPQANLLISTMDRLSPDYAVLVEPGADYTGGDAFHDLNTNDHVVEIGDADDFKTSIPKSYQDALKYFMLGAAIMNTKGSNNRYSMLIHPSHLTKVQKNIVEKITEDLEDLLSILNDKHHIAHRTVINDFKLSFRNEHESYTDFDTVMKYLINNLDQFKVYEFNTTKSGRSDIEDNTLDTDVLFKIYVGGNMLGRGVTIPNLTVTYMYRDSKVSAIDTLYQRARWFGYKRKYFDICRVYMTRELKRKFIAIASSERDLWSSMKEFLETQIEIKRFNRLFTLEHDKLILTRKTVSKTVTFERIKPGYTYDKTIMFKENAIDNNRTLVFDLINKYKENSKDVKFADDNVQIHKVINAKYSDIYRDFIEKYSFQVNSDIGPNPFIRILNQIKQGEVEDDISVVIMRYKTGQYRSLNLQRTSIKELPQGYNAGTNYPGDKNLPGYDNKMMLQIHLVYTNKDNTLEYIPILAFHNPLTKHSIRYATGDDYIDSL